MSHRGYQVALALVPDVQNECFAFYWDDRECGTNQLSKIIKRIGLLSSLKYGNVCNLAPGVYVKNVDALMVWISERANC